MPCKGLGSIIVVSSFSSLLTSRQCISGWKDVQNVEGTSFGLFSKAVVEMIHSHHDHEEHFVFPLFERRNVPGWNGALSVELCKEHKELMDSLGAAQQLCESAINGIIQSGELVRVFEAIQEHLLPHLAKEEAFFTVDRIAPLNLITVQDIDDVDAQIAAANQANTNMTIAFPVMLWTMPDDEYERFARHKVPFVVRKLIVTWILWYQGASSVARYCDHVRGTWNA